MKKLITSILKRMKVIEEDIPYMMNFVYTDGIVKLDGSSDISKVGLATINKSLEEEQMKQTQWPEKKPAKKVTKPKPKPKKKK